MPRSREARFRIVARLSGPFWKSISATIRNSSLRRPPKNCLEKSSQTRNLRGLAPRSSQVPRSRSWWLRGGDDEELLFGHEHFPRSVRAQRKGTRDLTDPPRRH